MRKRLSLPVLIFLQIFTLLFPVLVPWSATSAHENAVRNLNEEFMAYYQEEEVLSQEEIDYMRDHVKLLLVPGFLSKFFSVDSVPNTFSPQRDWLKSVGIEFMDVPVGSQDITDNNREVIKKAIDGTEKKIVLIGHSKGGVESLSTLLHHPEAQDKVISMVAIQSPFKGSPIAQSVVKSSLMSLMAGPLLSLVGGKGDTLPNLACERRTQHLEKWKDDILKLVQKRPVLTVSSSIPSNPYFMASMFFDKGEKSDGVVPVESAKLPGSLHVSLENASHTDLVDNTHHAAKQVGGEKEIDKVKFFQVLLKMVLARTAVNL